MKNEKAGENRGSYQSRLKELSRELDADECQSLVGRSWKVVVNGARYLPVASCLFA